MQIQNFDIKLDNFDFQTQFFSSQSSLRKKNHFRFKITNFQKLTLRPTWPL